MPLHSTLIPEALSALDPSPWVVNLTSEERGIYADMLHAEHEYREYFSSRGCRVLHADDAEVLPRRRTLIVVPTGFVLPDPKPICDVVSLWRSVVEDAAEAQGKRETVGSRGATLPVWLGLGGIDTPFTDPPPAYVAAKITTHMQTAYRGAALDPAAALSLLQDKLVRAEASLQHSIEKSKKARISGQEKQVAEITGAIGNLELYMQNDAIVSVRLASGRSWRINVRTTEKESISSTIATVALVPGTAETVIGTAPSRKKSTDQDVITMIIAGGIELRIKK
jgi:hypothetical protein